MQRITVVLSLTGAIQRGVKTLRNLSLELLSCIKKARRIKGRKRNLLEQKYHHEVLEETVIEGLQIFNSGK
jgi:hypothetical protein